MTMTQLIENQSRGGGEEAEEELSNESKQLLLSLPKEKGWRTNQLYWFQNFWCQAKEIQAIISCQRHFQAQDSDIILATIPKSGTTWLKALAFAIVNRKRFGPKNHPLLTSNPHDLVPFLEYKVYANYNHVADLSSSTRSCDPRLFGTHVPYASLPDSVKKSGNNNNNDSGCRVVYLCRNPFDTFISVWHFLMRARPASLGPLSMEEAFDMYCRGVIGYGPCWDHMLGYWKESIERPHKVLFMMYEDMKEDTGFYVRKLAEFLGYPFSLQEEREGVAEEISRLCSFQSLKELEVNKTGKGAVLNLENESLFRKGEVGDWVNHLTPFMVEKLTKVMQQNLGDSALAFRLKLVSKDNTTHTYTTYN
ncbi:hypothetical protein CsSME_00011308 [Camellia sinensis var. sinensis]